MDYKPTDIFPPIGIFKGAKSAWNSVMTIEHSPLRKLDPMVGHMVFQLLAYMWCAIFALYIGSISYFGISAAIHTILIAGIFITAATMREADKRPQRINSALSGYNGRGNGGEHN
jgi:hypothetical protein